MLLTQHLLRLRPACPEETDPEGRHLVLEDSLLLPLRLRHQDLLAPPRQVLRPQEDRALQELELPQLQVSQSKDTPRLSRGC